MGLIYTLIIGAAAGWLAGQFTKGQGFGLLGNLIVGIIGSFVGGFLFGLLQIRAAGVVGELVAAVVGAVVLLWLIGKIKK